MTDQYRIFGAELSPYSVKVRSYFRYKGIPHVWIARTENDMQEFMKFAKLPLIPLIVSSHGDAWQDSTPIIEDFEKQYPEPSIVPEDPVLAFLSALIEEYADEWGNKHMFHYRWWYDADQVSAAERLARGTRPHGADADIQVLAQMIRERMVPRLAFVGSHSGTKDQIEGSFKRLIGLLEAHLTHRTFLFGGRPALADFGLAAQIYECWTDPTPRKILEAQAPNTIAWVEQMLDPTADGPFESWDSLRDTLMPLLRDEVGALFLPWTSANADALAKGDQEFTVQLEGRNFSQECQKYHARSLAVLRERYSAVTDKEALGSILEETGCLQYLSGD